MSVTETSGRLGSEGRKSATSRMIVARWTSTRLPASAFCATCADSCAISRVSYGDWPRPSTIVEPAVNARAPMLAAATAARGPVSTRTPPRSTPTCGSTRARTAAGIGVPGDGEASTRSTTGGGPPPKARPWPVAARQTRHEGGGDRDGSGGAPCATRRATASACTSAASPGALTPLARIGRAAAGRTVQVPT